MQQGVLPRLNFVRHGKEAERGKDLSAKKRWGGGAGDYS